MGLKADTLAIREALHAREARLDPAAAERRTLRLEDCSWSRGKRNAVEDLSDKARNVKACGRWYRKNRRQRAKYMRDYRVMQRLITADKVYPTFKG